jgi:AcrR family transcriptional regulator
MAELASAVGVGRATLHRHFASRDALVAEMAERSVDRWEATQTAVDLVAVTSSGDAAKIEATLRALLAAYVVDADDFGFVLTDEGANSIPALQERAEALIDREVAFIGAAQRAGVLRADLPARWIGNVIYGVLVAARESLRRGEVARRDLDALVESTFLSGVKA